MIDSGTRQTFAYHKSLSPMLGVLLGLAIVETAVVHVVAMAAWGWRVALALVVIDLSAVLMLVRLLRSFRRLPIVLTDGLLTMRAGTLRSVVIDVRTVTGLREQWDAAAVKRRDMLNLALVAWPNVVLDLAAPVGRRGIVAIAHRLDDPEAFRAALSREGIGITGRTPPPAEALSAACLEGSSCTG